ncbi:MAG: hypothetical protein E3J73_01100 [Candidatus Bathyarchaeum sp.]|nr:MAG: hypothetical protein E3J73_01100 [Candidatus Bathyarchaeum sp.]
MSEQKLGLPLPMLALLIGILAVGSLIAGFYVNPATGEVLLPEGQPAFLAIVVAFLYGLSGYLKSTTPEKFEPVKFIITLTIALITSLGMFKLGIGYNEALHIVTNFCATTGALVVLENWLKVFIRQLGKG